MKSNKTLKTCSKCGKSFGCQNLERGCWCENHQLTQEQLEFLKKNYDNCLCEECLKLASKFSIIT